MNGDKNYGLSKRKVKTTVNKRDGDEFTGTFVIDEARYHDENEEDRADRYVYNRKDTLRLG